jgi:hypothetical protein
MVLDLSYINELPSEATEDAIAAAIEAECLKAIATYLTQVADTMEQKKIETLNVPTIRAMAGALNERLTEGTVSPTA